MVIVLRYILALFSIQRLKTLVMHTIEILEHTETRGANDSPDLAQEEKLSSSDIRRSMLGSFRQPQVHFLYATYVTLHACLLSIYKYQKSSSNLVV